MHCSVFDRIPNAFDPGLSSRLPSGSDSDERVNLWVRYINVYTSDEEKLTVEQINENHQVLQRAFNRLNTTELLQVKNLQDINETRYPYWDTVANMNIHFFPDTIEHVEYMRVSRPVDETSDDARLRDLILAAGRMKHVVNVYLASGKGLTRGIAELRGNVMYVKAQAIGSPEFPGQLGEKLAIGSVLVHEMGHVVGLFHSFNENQTCGTLYDDIPPQKHSNANAVPRLDEQGRLIGFTDNRYLDFSQGTSRSCPVQGDERFENSMNFMDYGEDTRLLMFSQGQKRESRRKIASLFDGRLIPGENETTYSTPMCYLDDELSPSFLVNPNPLIIEGGSMLPFPVTEADLFVGLHVPTAFKTPEELQELTDVAALPPEPPPEPTPEDTDSDQESTLLAIVIPTAVGVILIVLMVVLVGLRKPSPESYDLLNRDTSTTPTYETGKSLFDTSPLS